MRLRLFQGEATEKALVEFIAFERSEKRVKKLERIFGFF